MEFIVCCCCCSAEVLGCKMGFIGREWVDRAKTNIKLKIVVWRKKTFKNFIISVVLCLRRVAELVSFRKFVAPTVKLWFRESQTISAIKQPLALAPHLPQYFAAPNVHSLILANLHTLTHNDDYVVKNSFSNSEQHFEFKIGKRWMLTT